MRRKAIGGGTISVLVLAGLILAGGVLTRRAEAQPPNRLVRITGPVAVAPGDTVRIALFNLGPRSFAGSFGLLDAVTGEVMPGSASQINLSAGTGTVVDVVIEVDVTGAIGIYRGQRGRATLSFQFIDAEGKTTVYTGYELGGEGDAL